jgi:predicted dehydrogenase
MILRSWRFSVVRSFSLLLLFAPLFVFAQGSASPERKLGVGLYGSNGHQLRPDALAKHPLAQIIAVAGLRQTTLPEGVKRYATLEELIADPAVELISLCSPRRADQARDAIRCLEAGKHVYAEKPSAVTEAELDQILAAAKRSGRQFHEMAGTVFVQPYVTMRRLVREGAIGDVIQVFVQKSYRYGASRPQDEAIDGGMFLQAGIHAARMVEHAAGVRIATIAGWETAFGKPAKDVGEGKIAGTVQMTLENGGLATIIINYLNPPGTPLPHGNETLRIFGTKGYVESIDGGKRTRLVTASGIVEPLDQPSPSTDYFDFVAAHIARGAEMPITLEEELRPLRMLLRAKEELRTRQKTAAK